MSASNRPSALDDEHYDQPGVEESSHGASADDDDPYGDGHQGDGKRVGRSGGLSGPGDAQSDR